MSLCMPITVQAACTWTGKDLCSLKVRCRYCFVQLLPLELQQLEEDCIEQAKGLLTCEVKKDCYSIKSRFRAACPRCRLFLNNA
ncbi:E6 [Serinus canaria papillomavirus 1]|uniref:E6 n=1 Tax=Serinus canaria papillomavirus 1 TaxID=2094713 RepID=UPI000D0C3D7B|nr:E6 [Serinus canaria papillomavirus 1]AVH76288.1 E6 [Serinus canaria papillomavirus 1]